MFTLILFAVTYRLALETQYWTWINHLFCWGSLLMWFVYIFLECGLKTGIVTQGVMYWDIFNLMSDAVFWLTLLLAPLAAVLPAIVYKVTITDGGNMLSWMQVWKALYFPSDNLKVRQRWLEEEQQEDQNARDRERMNEILPPQVTSTPQKQLVTPDR